MGNTAKKDKALGPDASHELKEMEDHTWLSIALALVTVSPLTCCIKLLRFIDYPLKFHSFPNRDSKCFAFLLGASSSLDEKQCE